MDTMSVRKTLGRFASGVTVVTTARGTTGEVHGMTANAFTSVSLDPPLVLISVSTSAKMDRRIEETGRYGISVLSGEQKPLSLHFAGAAHEPDLVDFVWRDDLPLLDGALAHLTCSVRASYPAGDHTLHIGEIDGLWHRDGDPLVFFSGELRSLVSSR
ncbi:NADH-FMN oxidoreductase RutF, flavin reductase (DIM6/NTAB) family [Amycolatopsis xylanica]|uniref:NADH-FMN oxidoreductase RutF, flavin reductase (DIM6/NTAB) family n=2 Tax=Amycolatopsis xylanica TaxID=589385 RepID=A0A1H2U053_9PSEU|nr:NADH-FMN oxidoreductase RutF, flavin reductase (DIM6/NTAB) family [Amycolatopsis xylanica]